MERRVGAVVGEQPNRLGLKKASTYLMPPCQTVRSLEPLEQRKGQSPKTPTRGAVPRAPTSPLEISASGPPQNLVKSNYLHQNRANYIPGCKCIAPPMSVRGVSCPLAFCNLFCGASRGKKRLFSGPPPFYVSFPPSGGGSGCEKCRAKCIQRT